MCKEISAAIITDKNENILICRRPLGKHLALLWEFPGGKVEKGESGEECVIRECKEELDIDIEVLGKFGETTHRYEDTAVHIVFFICHIKNGKPINKEHEQIKWISAKELSEYDFCPADKDIVENLKYTKISADKAITNI